MQHKPYPHQITIGPGYLKDSVEFAFDFGSEKTPCSYHILFEEWDGKQFNKLLLEASAVALEFAREEKDALTYPR